MILGIRGIEESSIYQDIFAKGEAEGRVEGQLQGAVDEARNTLLRQGRKKLGPSSEAVQARIACAFRSRPPERPARSNPGRFELGRTSTTVGPI